MRADINQNNFIRPEIVHQGISEGNSIFFTKAYHGPKEIFGKIEPL